MSMTFKDLQDEVLRRATRNQGGTNFETATKNLVNSALLRIANEAPWRPLRRTATIDTIGECNTGTVSATPGSKTITFTGGMLIANGVVKGRRIKFSEGSSTIFTLDEITGENSATLDLSFDGDAAITDSEFTIYGQDIYNLPIQTGRTAAIWHEGFNWPFLMQFVTDRDFLRTGLEFDQSDTPEIYRMWGEDWVITQPRQASTLTASSSASADNAIVTIFGTVSGYPDSEQLTLNGTSGVTTSKSFSEVERVVASDSTTGRVTVTANSGADTVAVIPTGDTTAGIKYKKVQVWPQPDVIYKLNILYYKEPYRLVNDNDVHELGQDFDELIILLATSKMQGEQSKNSDIKNFFSLYQDELKILRRKNADKLDQLLSRERPPQAFMGDGRFNRGRAQSTYGPHRYVGFRQAGSRFGPASFF